MNIIIFGATGHTGSCIVDLALAQGHTVTAFARDPKSFSNPRSGLSIIRGDVLDATAVEQAIAGHDVVLSALGGRTLDPSTVISEGTRHIIQGMKKHEVRRIVAILASGIISGTIAPMFTNINAEHRRILEMLKHSELEWIAACPPYIRDYPFTGIYMLHTDQMPSDRMQISKFDLADFMLRQLNSDTYLQQAVGIVN
jgi:putative NADH-flavin reductase